MLKPPNGQERQKILENIASIHQTLTLLVGIDDYFSVAYLANTLGTVWETHEYLNEGIGYVSLVLNSAVVRSLPPTLLARLNLIHGNLARHQAKYATASSHYQAGLSQARDDGLTATKILSGMGEIAFRQGQYQTALDYYDQHLAINQQMSLATGVADAYNALGRLATVRGNLTEAREYHELG